MESFFRSLSEGTPSTSSDCAFADQGIQTCPFLRNINEPSSLNFSSPVNFKLFHGNDGVIPLSDLKQESAQPQFNPLATISLSSFGTGGFFGFGSFSEWNNQQKKSKSAKQESSHSHEALGDEWLVSGNCPIAKSYRAVSGVLPFVAKALQPPPGMKFKCPPAIVAARAALARTALVKTIRPQGLPTKMLAIGALGMAVNVPLGIWREHTEKFSPSWFVAVHAAVPFIAMLRKSVLMPKTAMAMTIAASILGQVIGSRAERMRLKSIAARDKAQLTVSTGRTNHLHVVGVRSAHCGELVDLDPLLLKVTKYSGDNVCC